MGQRLYNRYNYVLYGKDGEQLMNYSLKAELDNCYSYADSLDNDGYGARQKTGLKTREMLQFDLLQFLAYLSSSDQAELTLEIKFVREYLNHHLDPLHILYRAIWPGQRSIPDQYTVPEITSECSSSWVRNSSPATT